MIGSSNPRFNYLNEEGFLRPYGGCIVFNNGHLHPAFRTSYITKVILKDNIIEFTTRNSVYTFKIKDKVKTEKVLFELSKEDKQIFDDYSSARRLVANGSRTTLGSHYKCQIHNHHYSHVLLPFP